METQQTTDYDLFRTITSNREVDEKHVNKLVRAIRQKNLLHLNPIVCNNAMEVIDGQHRLEAARKLEVPVYYVMDANISRNDMATINSNAKNWNVMDYINFWTIEKRPGFDKLSSFLSENPLIPPSTALMMLSADGTRNTREIRDGVVDTSNYQQAATIAGILKGYRNMIEHAYERNFVLAVIAVVNNPAYDHAVMQSKLEYQSRSLVRCISKKQYIELLEEIYNYKSSKNRVKFC
jgi:hypothetical protein